MKTFATLAALSVALLAGCSSTQNTAAPGAVGAKKGQERLRREVPGHQGLSQRRTRDSATRIPHRPASRRAMRFLPSASDASRRHRVTPAPFGSP